MHTQIHRFLLIIALLAMAAAVTLHPAFTNVAVAEGNDAGRDTPISGKATTPEISPDPNVQTISIEQTANTAIAETTIAETTIAETLASLEPDYWSQSPLPLQGRAMYYNPGVMERVMANRFRHHNITSCTECIGYVALLRAGDLDRRVWLRRPGQPAEGPFWVVDVAAPKHILMLLGKDWVVDVDWETSRRWRMAGPVPVTVLANAPEDVRTDLPVRIYQPPPVQKTPALVVESVAQQAPFVLNENAAAALMEAVNQPQEPTETSRPLRLISRYTVHAVKLDTVSLPLLWNAQVRLPESFVSLPFSPRQMKLTNFQ